MIECFTEDDQSPLVSIIIPAYNCETFVAETLDSCLAQTYPNIEIIVVNDGSTDGTASVLATYGTRVKIIEQSNGGLAAARNSGHRAAKGKFIAWMDADDIAHPQRIEFEAEILNRRPSVVLVSSNFSAFVTGQPDYEPSHIDTYYDSFRTRGRATGLFASSFEIKTNTLDGGTVTHTVWTGNQFENLIWGNFVHPPTVMARKAALDMAGPFDTSLRTGSDYECILRLSRLGEFAYIDSALLRYRRGDQQMSESFVKGETWSEYRRILEQFKALEPDVFSRHQRTYLSTIALSYIHEAKTIGNKNRFKALQLIALSLFMVFLPIEIGDALIFILAPAFVVFVVRRYRRWRRSRKLACLG